MMRGFSPTQRMSIGHHADVAQAVARLLDALGGNAADQLR